MATKKTVAPKRSVKKTASIPAISLPPMVMSATKSKNVRAKKTGKKSVARKSVKKPEVIMVEEMNVGENESLNLPVEPSKEYVVVHRCANCEHVPFSIARLVTLYSVLIVLLSLSVLIQVGTIDVSKLIAFVSPSAVAAGKVMNR